MPMCMKIIIRSSYNIINYSNIQKIHEKSPYRLDMGMYCPEGLFESQSWKFRCSASAEGARAFIDQVAQKNIHWEKMQSVYNQLPYTKETLSAIQVVTDRAALLSEIFLRYSSVLNAARESYTQSVASAYSTVHASTSASGPFVQPVGFMRTNESLSIYDADGSIPGGTTFSTKFGFNVSYE
ncbi:hypothetical protein AAMO2058_000613000 [Amorphochlora amoebiformis]